MPARRRRSASCLDLVARVRKRKQLARRKYALKKQLLEAEKGAVTESAPPAEPVVAAEEREAPNPPLEIEEKELPPSPVASDFDVPSYDPYDFDDFLTATNDEPKASQSKKEETTTTTTRVAVARETVPVADEATTDDDEEPKATSKKKKKKQVTKRSKAKSAVVVERETAVPADDEAEDATDASAKGPSKGCSKCRMNPRGCKRCGGMTKTEAEALRKKKAEDAKALRRARAALGTDTDDTGCGKCRWSARGCARCKSRTSTGASPTAQRGAAKAKSPKDDKTEKSGSDGCGKCRWSARGCARCHSRSRPITSKARKAVKKVKSLLQGKPKQQQQRGAQAKAAPPTPTQEEEPDLLQDQDPVPNTPSALSKEATGRGVSSKRKLAALRKDDARLAVDLERGRRRHKGGSEPNQVAQESPKSVLDLVDRQAGSKKHLNERCFPKLPKFVRPMRSHHPMKSQTALFQEKKGQGSLPAAPQQQREREQERPHVWKNPEWWDPTDIGVCNAVKNVLHMSTSLETTSEEPKIRNEEWKTVRTFLLDRVSRAQAGSLYVSGVPGSGKSFIVQQAIASSLVEVFGTKKKAKVVHINCMTLGDPRRIFGMVLEKGFDKECTGGQYEKDHRYALGQLRKAAASAGGKKRKAPGDMVILVLDEVDHLYQNQGDVLYDLFSLAEMSQSNIVFLGIANSIDLTLRLLPHLHNIGVEPTMVNFRAYAHSDLYALMQERLQSLDGPVFDAKAVELCCRKIAATSGDMRKCLNAAYAALENFISQTKAAAAAEEEEGERSNQGRMRKYVDLQHMSLALGKCLKLPLINGMRALPQHQQMILCSTAISKETEVLLTSLFTRYTDLCASSKISALAFNEFENACVSLHDQGLIAVNKKKNLHSKTLKLKVKMADIVFALQGIRFFHNILTAGESAAKV